MSCYLSLLRPKSHCSCVFVSASNGGCWIEGTTEKGSEKAIQSCWKKYWRFVSLFLSYYCVSTVIQSFGFSCSCENVMPSLPELKQELQTQQRANRKLESTNKGVYRTSHLLQTCPWHLLLCWFVFDTCRCFDLLPLVDLKQEAKELQMCCNDVDTHCEGKILSVTLLQYRQMQL